MTTRSARRLAWLLWSISMAALAVGSFEGLLDPQQRDVGYWAPAIATLVFLVSFSTVGALISSRRPDNPIGWLLLGAGALFAAGTVAVSLDPDERSAIAQWVSSWSWGAGSLLALIPLLLFPDGALPSRRWRPVVWTATTMVGAFVVGSALAPGRIEDSHVTNPLGVRGIGSTLFPFLRGMGLVLALLVSVLAVVSLVVRHRRGDPQVREQLRWLVFAGVIVVLVGLAQGPLTASIASEALRTNIQNAVTAGALALVPIAIGFAILRHRLYDINLVIRKTIVFAILASFITILYVVVVVLVGSWFGDSLAISVVATALVAIAFHPVRERANAVASRLVYGERATPYEVLANFSGRIGEAYADDDVLPRMAQVLAAGTGAEVAVVWLRVGHELHPAAAFPADATPPVEPSDDAVEVLHQGEPLGALSVIMPPSEPMDPARRRLMGDLAAQAGLVLRNVRLIAELRASRQRLVAAQDDERRKIERNIHDGAQQQLVALAVRQRLAASMVGKDDDGVRRMLEGLPAALEAQARKAIIPVTIEPDGVGRYPQQIESAVYFSVLEALQNFSKYAEASRATVRLSHDRSHLTCEVIDDGAGFDTTLSTYGTGLQGIADRLDALGGSLDVVSAPGAGTTVVCRIPVNAERPA